MSICVSSFPHYSLGPHTAFKKWKCVLLVRSVFLKRCKWNKIRVGFFPPSLSLLLSLSGCHVIMKSNKALKGAAGVCASVITTSLVSSHNASVHFSASLSPSETARSFLTRVNISGIFQQHTRPASVIGQHHSIARFYGSAGNSIGVRPLPQLPERGALVNVVLVTTAFPFTA